MVSTDFAGTRQLLDVAVTYGDVFSVLEPRELKMTYRRLMKTVHPDRVAADQQTVAAELVHKLTKLYESAQAVASGTSPPLATMTSRVGVHTLQAEMSTHCDMTKGFRAASQVGSGGRETFIKVSCTPRDNELLAAEAAALKALRGGAGDEFVAFYPELVDSFMVAEGRVRLRVNALGWLDGFYNLLQIRHYRPDGLDPLDAAWVWRRLLWALGGAHEAGWLHSAVLPQHVMVHPAMHGVILADWCYCRQLADGDYSPLAAIVGGRRSWYPVEVLARQAPTQQTDLVMAARTLVYVLGGDAVSLTMPRSVPAAIQRYLVQITNGAASGNAFELLAQFDAVLRSLGAPYYPRRFRELVL